MSKLESATVKRGGKRKGAGRPTGTTRGPSTPAQIKRAERKGTARGRVPRIGAGVNVTTKIPAEDLELLKLWVAEAQKQAPDVTVSDAIRHCISSFFATNRPVDWNKIK